MGINQGIYFISLLGKLFCSFKTRVNGAGVVCIVEIACMTQFSAFFNIVESLFGDKHTGVKFISYKKLSSVLSFFRKCEKFGRLKSFRGS